MLANLLRPCCVLLRPVPGSSTPALVKEALDLCREGKAVDPAALYRERSTDLAGCCPLVVPVCYLKPSDSQEKLPWPFQAGQQGKTGILQDRDWDIPG